MASLLDNKPLRGVNLGGWLVLERWMTPSLFASTDAQDEYSFMKTPGALAKLRAHQKSFVGEEDFKWMAAHGVNAVRIPVGYWIFEGDTPYRSCIGRLDWAIKTAEKYNIRVLICLHGAPGSQSGEHHSGQIGRALWFGRKDYREQTTAVLVRLAERYAQREAVWGIELLNEPKAWIHQLRLRRFYKQAQRGIMNVARPGLVVVFHDAFMPRSMSGALRMARGFPVMMDVHWYQFMIPVWIQRRLPLWFNNLILRKRAQLFERLSRAQPIIVGEWSGVMGWQTLERFPVDRHEAIMHQYLEQQLDLYGNVAGWFYWNYKTESRGIFHFRSLIEDGHIARIS
ncbi:MAG: cellulase family glycosylhydrolase [Candidatus Saccharimonas sp.]